MGSTRYKSEEIAQLGEETYARDIRARVEKDHFGEFLVLDVHTGEYEIDPDETQAVSRMIARNPGGARYILRIGFRTAHRLGGRLPGPR